MAQHWITAALTASEYVMTQKKSENLFLKHMALFISGFD